MTIYAQKRDYIISRKPMPESIFKYTCIRGSKFVLKGLIKHGTFLVLVFLSLVTSNPVFLGWGLLFLLIQIILIFGNGGNDISHLILGIRLANAKEFRLYQGRDYYDYCFSTFWDRYRFNYAYELFYQLGSPLFQTPVMQENGLLYVDIKAYKLFIEDYFERGRLKPEFQKKTNNSAILNANTTRIFHDYEE